MPGIGTMLRPIATPLTIGGFDASVIDPVASAFREQGFLPMMAGAGGAGGCRRRRPTPLRPGDPIGVALVTATSNSARRARSPKSMATGSTRSVIPSTASGRRSSR